ncbi:MAG TPA: efflux RND transporter periplasmic adaptor subunit [Blastocatellia bacterium]|nr:efflux RND transporter periplasmic adaptor subunit [Blastocatellia bacterium]
MKKALRISLLILMLGGAAWTVSLVLRPTPLRVEAARVMRGPLQATIDAEGKTRVRDRFVVAAPVTGKLARIEFKRGNVVVRDEVLARIDPLPMTPLDPRQLAEAKARVAAAEQLKNEAAAVAEHTRADCEQAGRELARAEKLAETGDVSRQEFERARNAEQTCRQQLDAARFRAAAAASDVEVAKAALLAVEQAGQSGKTATVLVRAPVAGRVLRVPEENERVVTAGTPLLELSNTTLEIAIDVLSTDAVKVAPGMKVLIEGWGGDQALPARVRLIEPSGFTKVSALGVEEQRVNVIADFLNDPGRLGDGYRVEARLVVWESDNVLRVPTSALFRNGRRWGVFVIENNQARERLIEIGHRTAFDAEVLHGLSEGTEVILHPNNQISDGLSVRAK